MFLPEALGEWWVDTTRGCGVLLVGVVILAGMFARRANNGQWLEAFARAAAGVVVLVAIERVRAFFDVRDLDWLRLILCDETSRWPAIYQFADLPVLGALLLAGPWCVAHLVWLGGGAVRSRPWQRMALAASFLVLPAVVYGLSIVSPACGPLTLAATVLVASALIVSASSEPASLALAAPSVSLVALLGATATFGGTHQAFDRFSNYLQRDAKLAALLRVWHSAWITWGVYTFVCAGLCVLLVHRAEPGTHRTTALFTAAAIAILLSASFPGAFASPVP